MAMNQKDHLTEGPVVKKLFLLTVPMIFGMLSMVLFNLVDSFFVSRLGVEQLAAMGFTFPIVMLVASIALGFSVATASVVSNAIGKGNPHEIRRLTTDSLIISLFIVVICAALGLFTMDRVFRLLGADGRILFFVKQYMRIWYLGVAFVVIPMVGNSAIRACGDTLLPSLIMVTSTIVNIILDPLLIFGLWIFPKMGLEGAAIATVIARAVGLVMSLLILHFKEKLIELTLPPMKELIASAKQIFYIGIPSAASRILMPLTMAIVIRIVATFGPVPVAAMGVAIKIEMFVFMVIMALSTALIPFVGQNFGAKNLDRVKEAVSKANTFSFIWGLGAFIVLIFLAVPLGNLFGKNAEVAQCIALYLWIVPISYGLRGSAFLVSTVLNAVRKPFISISVNLARMFVFYIPLAIIGRHLGGLQGLFTGLTVANIGAGLMALFVWKLSFRKLLLQIH